jgi:hypothetical protein
MMIAFEFCTRAAEKSPHARISVSQSIATVVQASQAQNATCATTYESVLTLVGTFRQHEYKPLVHWKVI